MSELFPPSLAEMIACIEREIRFRVQVYPRRVAEGKMRQAKAEREIETMRAILQRLCEARSKSA